MHYLSHKNEGAINDLIPEAERFANFTVPDCRMYTKGRDDWSCVFIDKMNELAIAAGLRIGYDDLMKVKNEIQAISNIGE